MLDIRAIRIVSVRPPVIAFRKEIVQASGTALTVSRGDRDGLLVEILRGLGDDSRPLDLLQVERSDRGAGSVADSQQEGQRQSANGTSNEFLLDHTAHLYLAACCGFNQRVDCQVHEPWA